jgi:predicted nucleotidyltransferase
MERVEILEIICDILKKNGIREAYLLGSFARKEESYNDIDIAIQPPKDMSLLGLAHLENLLEEKVGKKIDLGVLDAIHPMIEKSIRSELVPLI